MSNASDFIIKNGVLKEYTGSQRLVTIPDSVTEIGSSAFEDCSGLTIHAKTGSYAETYAKKHKIPFVAE